MRVDYVNMIQMKDIEVTDTIVLDDTIYSQGFNIERRNSREMPYENLITNAITYEMSWDRHVNIRKVSTLLDRLSNVGGLYGAITPIFAAIVTFLNYRG